MTLRKVFALTLAVCFLVALGSISPASAASNQKPSKPTLQVNKKEFVHGDTAVFSFTYDENSDSVSVILDGQTVAGVNAKGYSSCALKLYLTVHNINSGKTGTVYLRAKNEYGETDSDKITIRLNPPLMSYPLEKKRAHGSPYVVEWVK